MRGALAHSLALTHTHPYLPAEPDSKCALQREAGRPAGSLGHPGLIINQSLPTGKFLLQVSLPASKEKRAGREEAPPGSRAGTHVTPQPSVTEPWPQPSLVPAKAAYVCPPLSRGEGKGRLAGPEGGCLPQRPSSPAWRFAPPAAIDGLGTLPLPLEALPAAKLCESQRPALNAAPQEFSLFPTSHPRPSSPAIELLFPQPPQRLFPSHRGRRKRKSEGEQGRETRTSP